MPSIKCLTPKFRVSYPAIFESSAPPKSDKKFFSVVAIFDLAEIAKDPEQTKLLTAMKQALADCAREKWGDKLPSKFKSPWRKGEEKMVDGVYSPGYGPNTVFVTLKTEDKNNGLRPGLVDQQKLRITDQSLFYAGCYAHATINAYAWTHLFSGSGVSFGLQNVQKIADGEPLGGGRAKAEDDFSAVTGGADVVAPDAFNDMFS